MYGEPCCMQLLGRHFTSDCRGLSRHLRHFRPPELAPGSEIREVHAQASTGHTRALDNFGRSMPN